MTKEKRKWIKGHFYMGCFYGLCFGVIIGFLFGIGLGTYLTFVSAVIAIVFYFISNGLEEMSYKYPQRFEEVEK